MANRGSGSAFTFYSCERHTRMRSLRWAHAVEDGSPESSSGNRESSPIIGLRARLKQPDPSAMTWAVDGRWARTEHIERGSCRTDLPATRYEDPGNGDSIQRHRSVCQADIWDETHVARCETRIASASRAVGSLDSCRVAGRRAHIPA